MAMNPLLAAYDKADLDRLLPVLPGSGGSSTPHLMGETARRDAKIDEWFLALPLIKQTKEPTTHAPRV
jgi:hypothetical protein